MRVIVRIGGDPGGSGGSIEPPIKILVVRRLFFEPPIFYQFMLQMGSETLQIKYSKHICIRMHCSFSVLLFYVHYTDMLFT